MVHCKKTDAQTLAEEELSWILMYADDIVLISEDSSKLQQMVTAIHAGFQRSGLMISIGKTKAMQIHVPLPG
jgi:hypothetical protein